MATNEGSDPTCPTCGAPVGWCAPSTYTDRDVEGFGL